MSVPLVAWLVCPPLDIHLDKFALEGFTESLSTKLESQNIVVKLVEPGGVDTPSTRERRSSIPETRHR